VVELPRYIKRGDGVRDNNKKRATRQYKIYNINDVDGNKKRIYDINFCLRCEECIN